MFLLAICQPEFSDHVHGLFCASPGLPVCCYLVRVWTDESRIATGRPAGAGPYFLLRTLRVFPRAGMTAAAAGGAVGATAGAVTFGSTATSLIGGYMLAFGTGV